MFSEDKKLERLTLVAQKYYKQELTQSQIAKELGISRPMVSVLLSEARAQGIVTITINEVRNAVQLMAQQLQQKYGLKEALVVRTSAGEAAANAQVAQAAYAFCFENAFDARIGLGWGSMIGFMADYAQSLPDALPQGGKLLPLVGGIGATYRSYHTNELARLFSSKTGKPAYYLYLPAFFDSEQEKQMAFQMESCQTIQNEWDQLDKAILNISNYPSYPDLGVEYRYGNRLASQKAVGRLLSHYYTLEGQIVQPCVDNALQASLPQLARARQVVALASSLLPPQAVVGALRLGVITHLILSDSLAEQVLAYS